MFVKQSVHDEALRQLAESNAEVARLNAQLASLSDNETAIQALTSEKDLLTQQVNALTGNVETLNTANTELTQQVTVLTAENATLKKLPGATTATTKSETEHNNGEAVNELDKLNENLKNSDDINANIAMVEKFFK